MFTKMEFVLATLHYLSLVIFMLYPLIIIVEDLIIAIMILIITHAFLELIPSTTVLKIIIKIFI